MRISDWSSDVCSSDLAEDDLAPRGVDRVIDVDDRRFRAFEAVEAGADEVGAALGEHLRGDVVGDAAVLDEAGDEVELGRAGAGEADFDFLEADADEQVEDRKSTRLNSSH